MAVRSFGLVTVATPGTPARASANVPVNSRAGGPTGRVPLQSIMLQAHPDNTGKIYIFLGGGNFSGDHRTTLDVAVAILPMPGDPLGGPFGAASWGIPNSSAGINLSDFWIDADEAGDGVIVSGTEQ